MTNARHIDWEHLRSFEVVGRLGSLTEAAQALGISQSSVSRHLKRLETLAGSPLLLRESPIVLTARGQRLFQVAQSMARAAVSVRSALEDADGLRGEVTLATIGEVLRWGLAPALPTFRHRYPDLRLTILANNRVQSLAMGDADIALRMKRPQRGELVARRLRTEHHALYRAPTFVPSADAPWFGLAAALRRLPEQLYSEHVFERPAALRVEDLESLGLLVQQKMGVAVLPKVLAERLSLVPVSAEEVGGQAVGPAPSRELWMVVHQRKQHVPKVRAVMSWLSETLVP